MKVKGSTGSYSITSKDIDASAPNLGAALSKALTFGTRIQLARELADGDIQSIYIRKLGEEVVARIDITCDLIATHVLV